MAEVAVTKTINFPQLQREMLTQLGDYQLTMADGVIVCHDDTVTVAQLQALVDAHVAVDVVGNEATLRDRADQALAVNRAFLAISAPTNAQTVAQVKALTRQQNGIIRLLLRKLDGTD